MKTKQLAALGLALALCLETAIPSPSLPAPVIARDAAAAQSSFYEMHLGLFGHYMFPGKKYQWGATLWPDGSAVQSLDELADNFDAADFAEKADLMHAQYVIFTTSHANMNALFPSKVLQRHLPGHTSKRDVLRDVITAMKAKKNPGRLLHPPQRRP